MPIGPITMFGIYIIVWWTVLFGVLPLVEGADDQPTADLLATRLDTHEKTAWMLRSLLEE